MSRVMDRPEDFFRSLLPGRDALLVRLETEAAAEGIPIIGPAAGRLLQMLAAVSGAARILELGTATGYSAIHLARGSADSRVVTVELRDAMAERAAASFAEAGLTKRIELLRGDALVILAGLEESFDLAFLDIDKGSYLDLLPHLARVIAPGGLLVADNTSFSDAVPFVEALSRDPRWEELHLYMFLPGHSPERDAMTVARRLDRGD